MRCSGTQRSLRAGSGTFRTYRVILGIASHGFPYTWTCAHNSDLCTGFTFGPFSDHHELKAHMAPKCPSANTQAIDQSSFWDAGNLNWDEHRIGWAIGGGCAALVSLCFVRHCSFSTGGIAYRQYLSHLFQFGNTVGEFLLIVECTVIDKFLASNYNRPNEQRQV
ncbi:hypothetical protein JVT61DRAFT_8802 [Boletus reticuloceps]|uniref:Uncharacterized protein n=1 Tax=Boletus reticuloceps TaxID=495285 RepID=A0A8I2YHL3_9AGAM|nr:hypothetical protein JVT61DRAFT_8802 [Boletus reticuloceps]